MPQSYAPVEENPWNVPYLTRWENHFGATPGEHMKLLKVAALLDTMWGDREGLAPRYFRINPLNNSGRRLLKICGTNSDLFVTNACRELVTSATQKGTLNPAWVKENLTRLEKAYLGHEGFDVLLICGKRAQKAFYTSGYVTRKRVIEIMHPAARSWSKKLMESTAREIQKKGGSLRRSWADMYQRSITRDELEDYGPRH